MSLALWPARWSDYLAIYPEFGQLLVEREAEAARLIAGQEPGSRAGFAHLLQAFLHEPRVCVDPGLGEEFAAARRIAAKGIRVFADIYPDVN